jgi:thioester reductase-like protein
MSRTTTTAFVTGFPTNFVACRVVGKLLEDPDVRVRCLVQPKFLARAEQRLGELARDAKKRVDVVLGDIAALDLGLSGREYVALAGEIDVIHHCAAVTYLGVDKSVAETVNVGGAREIVELAETATDLGRLVCWSTALVSGKRRGYVLEEELDDHGGFRNAIEQTRFRAERIVRGARDRVPVTILRPATIVGDSTTGEIDRFMGPYLLVLLVLGAPPDLRIPMPGRGDVPLHLVPIDYVVDAGAAIASDPRSVGRTFHIVDPEPLTARRVFELIAKAAGRPVPRGFLPTNLAAAILRTPGLDKVASVPRAFLEQLATEVVYDDRGAREVLAGRGLSCPPFESYVKVMVDHVRSTQNKAPGPDEAPEGQGPSEAAADPLD